MTKIVTTCPGVAKRVSGYLLLLFFAAFLIVIPPGCGKEDDPAPESEQDNPDENVNDENDDDTTQPEVSDSLTIILDEVSSTESSQLIFDSNKDAALLIIKSNNSWTASTGNDWLALAATSGNTGATGIIVGASLNTGIPRTGEITISSGDKSHKVNIEQSGAPVITFSVNDSVSFRMVKVDGGTFEMGSNELLGQGPVHTVTLTDYYICETEVTNQLWQTITGFFPYTDLEYFSSRTGYDLPQKPVSAVSWYDITVSFLPEIKALTGLQFKLPTEAQWEYAAMGGTLSEGYDFAGSDELDDVAWHEANSDDQKHEVAQKDPNELGLYDMSGNVSEWCNDWYADYDWQEEATNPVGPGTGTYKVIRGGNFTTPLYSINCNVKARDHQIPDCYDGCWGNTGDPDEPVCFFCQTIGFRFVLDLE